jgi:hypothetical protein
MANPNNTFMYDISGNTFDRDESSYRREHAQVTSEFERIRPMFAHTAGFNNKLFNKVFDHIKSSKGPSEESIPEPESMFNTRMPTYGTAEDGGQNMLKEDREIRGMTQLERAYRSHTNPDTYNESTIERCRSKPDFKERPLSSQEAKQKIDAYRQIVPNTQDSRPQIQMQPIYPSPQIQAAAPQHFQAPPPQFNSPSFQAAPPQFNSHSFQAPPPQFNSHSFQAAPPQFNSHSFQAAPPQFQAAPPQFQAAPGQQFQSPAPGQQFQSPAPGQRFQSQYQPIEYQTDFRVREPPQRTLPPPPVHREEPRRTVPPVQNHRRTNTITHGPDDYRFYAQDKSSEERSVEQDLTDLKKMVKKQELIIKLLLARDAT